MRRWWNVAVVGSAVVAAVLGMVILAYFILMAIALNSWGSNK